MSEILSFFRIYNLSFSKFLLFCFSVAFIEAAFFGVASASVHFFDALTPISALACVVSLLLLGVLRFVITSVSFQYFYRCGASITDSLLVGYKSLTFLQKTLMMGKGGVSLFTEKSHSLISGFFMPLFSIVSGAMSIFALSLIEFWLLGISFLVFILFTVILYGALFYMLRKRLDKLGNLIVKNEFEVSAFSASFIRGFKTLHSLSINRLAEKFHEINSSLQRSRASVNFFGQFSRLSLELLGPIALLGSIFLTTDLARLTNPNFLIDSVVGLVILQRLIPLWHQVSVGLTTIRSAMWNVREFTSIGIEIRSGSRLKESRSQQPIQDLDSVIVKEVRTPWMPASIQLSGEFFKGEVVLITGPSGVGKTSFLDIFALLNRDFAGKITCSISGREFDYNEITSKVSRYCTQDYVMFNGTVKDNLELLSSNGVLSSRQVEVFSALNLPNDSSFLNQNVSLLSGGEQQRVALARLFCDAAPVLILDEPSSGLDALAASGLAHLIATIQKRHIIFVASHDQEFIQMLKRHPVKEVEICPNL